MNFTARQDELSAMMNEYLIRNPKILKQIPQGSFVIPIDSKDQSYFNYSMRLITSAINEGKKDILVAILVDNKWIFNKNIIS